MDSLSNFAFEGEAPEVSMSAIGPNEQATRAKISQLYQADFRLECVHLVYCGVRV